MFLFLDASSKLLVVFVSVLLFDHAAEALSTRGAHSILTTTTSGSLTLYSSCTHFTTVNDFSNVKFARL